MYGSAAKKMISSVENINSKVWFSTFLIKFNTLETVYYFGFAAVAFACGGVYLTQSDLWLLLKPRREKRRREAELCSYVEGENKNGLCSMTCGIGKTLEKKSLAWIKSLIHLTSWRSHPVEKFDQGE